MPKARENTAANLDNVNLEEIFCLLGLWEHRRGCVCWMVGRANQKEPETTCVGRDWRGRRFLLRALIGTQVMLPADSPGMESAAEFGCPNASEIAQPQEPEGHI